MRAALDVWVVAEAFDPAEPRDDHGRWSLLRAVRNAVRTDDGDAQGRLRKAKTGTAAKRATASSDGFLPGSDGYHTKDTVLTESQVGAYQRAAIRLNRRLRTSGPPAGPQFDSEGVAELSAEDVAFGALEAMMGHPKSALRDDISVERGVQDPTHVFGDAWRSDGDNTGLTWEDAAFVSTSTSGQTAEEFARLGIEGHAPLVMTVLAPKGIHAIRFGVHGSIPQYNAEDEVVLDRGLRFRVIADHGLGADGIHRVDVAVIGGPDK